MQRKYVINPQASAYVDASAGSGKTKLLIDRIIRLLLSGVTPSKILCITFTNAAAAEMSNRLNSKLLSFLTMTDEQLNDELESLYDSKINQAIIQYARGLFMECISESPRIETLHGFSAKILNKMQIININDNLIREHSSILDDDTKLDLLYESFNAVVLQDGNAEISNALKTILRKYNPGYILELIGELWMQISNTNKIRYKDEGLSSDQIILDIKERLYQLYNINSNKQDIIQEYINHCDYELLTETVAVLLEGKNITSRDGADAIQKFITQKDYDTFYLYLNILLTGDFKPRSRLPLDSAMCKKYEHLKEFLLQQQEILSDIMEHIHSSMSLELNLGFNIIAYYTLQQFNKKKKELHLFEYSDLIQDSIKIISNSNNKMALLYSIDMGLEHILIDEAQDLSEMQWSLIKTIADEFFVGIGTTVNTRTIFIVGDFKQAIFGFQGAAPYVFQQVKEYFRNNVISAGQIWYEIQLDTCYRCAPEILDVVDDVCNLMKESFDLAPENHIKHHSIEDYGYGVVQCHEVNSNPISQTMDESWYVAEQISQTIDDWLKNKKIIGRSQQIIMPQDIMILLRKRSILQDHLVAALKLKNIPISNLASKSFGNSIYIYDLLAALRFISQPFDKMNLVALLKAHPFNYTDHYIFELCRDGSVDIYSKIRDIQLIDMIMHQAKLLDLKEFCQWYLDQVYRIENKETTRFKNYILTYYQTTNPFKISVQHFIIWLSELIGNKQQKLYDNNSIRITTIHSAKGLEAPVVILADPYKSNKTFNNKFAYADNICLLNSKHASQKVKSIIKRDELSLRMENIRLLYVAMTRPKNELHVFGTYNSQDSWYSLIKSTIYN